MILSHGRPIVATLLQGLRNSSPGVVCAACACTARFAALGGPGIAPVVQLLLDALKPLLKHRQQAVRSVLCCIRGVLAKRMRPNCNMVA